MTENNENCETCTHQGTCPSRNSGEAVTCEVDPGSKIKHNIIIASGKGSPSKPEYFIKNHLREGLSWIKFVWESRHE